MNNLSAILVDREYRSNFILSLAKESDIVAIKANIPGSDKRVKESFLIVRYFTGELVGRYGGAPVILDGADGMCAVIPVKGENLKQTSVKLEEGCPIGRFADIDICLRGGQRSLSRGYMRKCLICEKDAFVCARQGNHSAGELLDRIQSGAREYFSARLYELIEQSLKAELDLEDKFGLVTPTSQGSHPDMDYNAMRLTHGAIIPKIVEMFWAGFDADSPDSLLKKLRPIGRKAEEDMFTLSKVNTYKGFIFIAGILVSAIGYLLSTGKGDYAEISEIIKRMCIGVTHELKEGGNTFGMQAYKNYGFTGARGHAEGGLESVFKAEALIDNGFSNDSLLRALTFIVGDIEDTVLLKRSGCPEKYDYFKNAIKSVDISDKKELKSLNSECVKSGISIGGSADVLVCAIILKKLKKLWYFDKTQ